MYLIFSVNRYGFKIAAQNVENTNLNTTSLCLHQWAGNIHLLQSTMEFLMENRIQEAQWVRIRVQRNIFLFFVWNKMYGISSKVAYQQQFLRSYQISCLWKTKTKMQKKIKSSIFIRNLNYELPCYCSAEVCINIHSCHGVVNEQILNTEMVVRHLISYRVRFKNIFYLMSI